MTTFADLDLSGSHAWPNPSGGQVVGQVFVEGSRTIVYPRGATEAKQDVLFGVSAWQGFGTSGAANSFQALRYLLQQLRELSLNQSMQPVFIGWTSTAQGGQYNVADLDDGWYVIENLQPDYQHNVVAGYVTCRATVSLVAPAVPSALAVGYTGASISSGYTAAATPLVAFPIGSTGQAPTTLSRTGGEGIIPISVNPGLNPAAFVRPATVAGLYQGGVRVYDTMIAGGNAVPAAPTFVNPNWVQVYGTLHDFVGDCVVTNGLLLLLFQVGQSACPSVYVWNTNLSPAGWQQVASLNYRDQVGLNLGTIRELNLDRVGLLESRVRTRLNTSAGNWAELRLKLQNGRYDARIEWQPLTETNSRARGLELVLTSAIKIAANETGVVDVATSGTGAVAASQSLGFGVGIGATVNQPLVGWLYANAPAGGQPLAQSTTLLSFGDSAGPTQGNFRVYGFFAQPFTTTPANLMAEAESGALGTGWSSVADGAASGGNTAKVASGTAGGNADLFGTSWQPPPGQYGIPFRIRVTSAASTTAQLRAGWWDLSTAAFVPLASTLYAPSQWSTSYLWGFANWRQITDGVLNGTTTVTSATAIFSTSGDDTGKAVSGAGILPGTTIASVTNPTAIVLSQAATATASGVTLAIGGPVTAPAGHNVQWRVVTVAALTTDFFIDEAALIPIQSATLGVDSLPGDIWSQWAFLQAAKWVVG